MYPNARRSDVVEDLHGEMVADPYRWLEALDSDETRAFVAAENELTESVLSKVDQREEIRRRLTELWAFPRFSVPFERGGRWFQWRNPGLANQHTLYVMSGPEDEGRPILDPNDLSPDGTVAVNVVEVSPDGRHLAYSLSSAGSDWQTWRVRDVDSGADLPDAIKWSKFSGAAWLKDASGLFYTAPEPPRPGEELVAESGRGRLLFHQLGTSPSTDAVIYEAPDQPEWMPSAEVTDDGRYLVISVERGTFPESQVHVVDLYEPERRLRPLIGDFLATAQVISNEGQLFHVLTDLAAERRRIVAISLDAPDPANWIELIPETDDTLVGAHRCGDAFVCHYLHDAYSVLRVHDLDGAFRHGVALPSFSAVEDSEGGGTGVQGSERSMVFHFKVVSFLESGSLHAHDVSTGDTRLLRPSAAAFDSARFVTEQLFVPSADGTAVPMFLSRRRDVVASGDVRVLMHGYGGFNIPITPAWRTSAAVWMERGGVFAETVLRGGGEYGRAWNLAGRLANKQNVFDDFAACARWLATTGWSRPDRIAVCGASNGGLLVGASIVQHPELFGAAVAEVGVLDLLRFHKFTIGWAWTSDYGDPDDPEQYGWPRAYSPLHNLAPSGRYPATLIMTGDHDDRVVPAHSYKFAAALQAAQAGAAPILLRVEVETGHGLGKPTTKQIAERTDFLAFLEMALG